MCPYEAPKGGRAGGEGRQKKSGPTKKLRLGLRLSLRLWSIS